MINYDISGLGGKIEDHGATSKGRLSASEFNLLVSAVQENQEKAEALIENTGGEYC